MKAEPLLGESQALRVPGILGASAALASLCEADPLQQVGQIERKEVESNASMHPGAESIANSLRRTWEVQG